MKVILLTDVPKIGNKYDVLELKDGYAKNVLIAKGLACLATKGELAKLEDKKKQIAKKKQLEIEAFKSLISEVNNKVVTIKAKANEKGHLFKAVGAHDVAEAIKKMAGVEIEEKSLIMEHIKELGSSKVLIKRGDLKGECEIVIEAM